MRTSSAQGDMSHRPASARSALNSKNLHQLDRKTNSIGVRKPVEPELQVFTGEEAKVAAQVAQQKPPSATPNHKNFGKVPKYIERYKEEAQDLA